MNPVPEALGNQPSSVPTDVSGSGPTITMATNRSSAFQGRKHLTANNKRWASRRAVLGSVVTLATLFALGVSACTGSSSPPAEFLNRPILYELESRGSVVLRGESIEKVWPVTATTFVDFLVKGLNYRVSWEQIDKSRWILRSSFVDRLTKATNKIDMMLELANHKMACGDKPPGRACEGVVVLVSDFVFNGERPSQNDAWDFIIDVRKQAFESM